MRKLEEVRRRLKLRLFARRVMPGAMLVCCGCGQQFHVSAGADLHEVFVTKGDVQGASDLVKIAINDWRNCFFVERKCHDTNRVNHISIILENKIGGVTIQDLRDFLDELVELGLDERVIKKHYGILKEVA